MSKRLCLIFLAGFVAGTVATAVQLMLWWAAEAPLPETLYRDTRLTATMLMSRDIISPQQLFQPPDRAMWLVATLIHYTLSLLYAAVFYALARRVRCENLPLLGLGFGLGLYFINMYGATLVLPWFALVRDWITLVTHAVFGLCLGLVVRANTRPNAPLLPI